MINKLLIAFILLFPFYLFSQDVIVESFATGFSNPVNIQHAGDDRLFIVEQDGIIKILNTNGTTNAMPFLNISSIVSSLGNEQGLLGLAFHPNYASNGFFFLNYTNNSGNTVIARYSVSANVNIADQASGQIILTISQPYLNHNGGSINFGPDGFLYIGMGDGGDAGDPQNNAQNGNSLLGKILRIDVGVDVSANYVIPADNPFVGNVNILDEIWAIGVRNPWKFSFDALDGDMWIGDVGQDTREEVNHTLNGVGGLNYGWRCYEADLIFNTSGCGNISNYTFPIATYNLGGSPYKCAVTGGYVYRGSDYPDFNGLYFYADFCNNEIRTIDPNNAYQVVVNGPFSGNISSFGQDVNGELYYSGLSNGTIYKIKDATIGINDINFENDISIAPNPAKNQTIIKSKSGNYKLKDIQIFNILGKMILNVKMNNVTEYQLDVDKINEGIYIIKIDLNNNKTKVKKLIIE
jgi:glucose/arabinose dehydrogenase